MERKQKGNSHRVALGLVAIGPVHCGDLEVLGPVHCGDLEALGPLRPLRPRPSRRPLRVRRSGQVLRSSIGPSVTLADLPLKSSAA